MIDSEVEAEILRLHYGEKWKIGTISEQLGVHYTTVQRVVEGVGMPTAKKVSRSSIVDPYMPFVMETLEKYPKVPASRIFEMVKQRGYPGKSEGHFRRFVALHRPQPPSEKHAYHRLRTLPGEQAQVDWGHFGHLAIGQAKRMLMAFVLVLSFSRYIFLRFFTNQKVPALLQGHINAFESLGGVPRVILYDNPKTIVLQRWGKAIRFNEGLLNLAGHYRYEPRPVAVARGNEKGRVERAIRYIRQSFWPARTFANLEDLNGQAEWWCKETAANRPCPEDRNITVKEAYEKEKDKLLVLPDNPFPAEETKVVKVGKTPYFRFDLNDYSLPYTHTRRTITVAASEKTVRAVDGEKVIAEHERSYDKGAQIEDERHIEELTKFKESARRHRKQDRLIEASPKAEDFLCIAAQRGAHLGSYVGQLTNLLDTYGASELDNAFEEVLRCNVIYPNAVKFCLEKRRQQRNEPPPVAVQLPDDPRVKNLVVCPQNLEHYDLKEDNKQ